ncbi:hypothetical protein IQ232_21650 [Microcystis aeruginosa LEGE 11464]|jgi:hypothetical protein|uniref:hypothetical protein n=1 Tax=Microcystis aeruginosa TaxID=1126 RepID=UPI001882B9A6|nr:hypothetical protein [Microcystis aeruginosa]MBE9092226.1 hypothetical protein [Microcystis aeruginosa LEGE 11464]
MPYLDFLIKELNNNGSEVIDIIKSLSIDQVIVWVKYSQSNQMPIDGIVENDSVKFLRALLYDEGKKGVIRLHFWTKSLNVASYFDRGSIHRDRFNAVSKAFAGLKMLDIRFKTTAIQSLKSSPDRGTSKLKSLCSIKYRHRLQKKISHIYLTGGQAS